jgi:hypothetical protein
MLQLGIRGLGIARFKFNVLAWFAKNEPGAWYDPSDFLPNWRRNLLTYTEDFSNAAWTKSGITPTYGASDPDGGNTATSLKATVATGQIYRNLPSETLGIQTVWLRRKTGAGGVLLYNGTATIPLTITSSWAPFSLALVTKTYYVLNIVMNTIGDEIDIWHPQVEQSSSATAYQKITDGVQDYFAAQPQPVLFQDSAGTLPAALEYPVGLMLDKSKGLALGAELVTNGDFSNGTVLPFASLSPDATLVWSDGAAKLTSNTAGVKTTSQAFPTTVGMWYVVSGLLVAANTPNAYLGVNGGYFRLGFDVGITKSFMFLATGATTAIVLRVDGAGFYADFDNISVKQIAGNHAYQATSANRPILSSRVNLLTKTEDFSDAVWVKTGITTTNNYAIAPDGTLTAIRAQFSGVNQLLGQYVTPVVAVGVSLTNSIWLKGPAGETINVNCGGFGIPKTLSGQWQQFTVSANNNNNCFGLDTYGGSTARDLLIWHIDGRPTNSGALLPPYQRVNTASDYDSVGFPLYLKANGTSSAMSTNSIDFTSTDKMTVVTGVRKLSDAVQGNIIELSSISTNAGAFAISDPFAVSSPNVTFGVRSQFLALSSAPQKYAPVSYVGTVSIDRIAPLLALRVDGAINTSSSVTQGSGNFGNYPLYLFSRNNGTINTYFNGQFYGAVIRGAQSDTASVTQTEQYMAQKTGITF